MNNDEILQAAKEAGLTGLSLIDVGYLERFAAIIEKRTIERCAVVCEKMEIGFCPRCYSFQCQCGDYYE